MRSGVLQYAKRCVSICCMNPSDHIRRAIALMTPPTQTALAIASGAKHRQAVNRWIRKGHVPPKYALAIEAATDGKVTRHDLCPSVFGAPPA